MRRKFLSSITVVSLFALASSALAAEYAFDTNHSKIGFSVAHLVISSVDGRFSDFSGTVTYDADDITGTAASVSIKAASINTDNERRDGHLKNADFFDVEKFPEITFAASKVVKKGKGHVMVGKLTMHGVEKSIELPFEIKGPITDPWGNGRIGIEAHMMLDRKDYGLTYDAAMEAGGLVVGEEITIDLVLEAVEKKEEKK